MTTANLSLVYQHQDEVARYCEEKGWYDPGHPVTFGESMVMLVTEVSELQQAYKNKEGDEAIASEFADIYIRLLDDCHRFGLRLSSLIDLHRFSEPIHADPKGGFFPLINTISAAVEAYRVHGLQLRSDAGLGIPGKFADKAGPEIARLFARLYFQIGTLCSDMGYGLDRAFDRKMAVNWTRAHRHGGKKL